MKRTATTCSSGLELLERLVKDQTLSGPTTLLVCSTKEDFLHDIALSILQGPPATDSRSSQDVGSKLDDPQARNGPFVHSFLKPTLGLLSRANSIYAIFCASVPSLRAYLATLGEPQSLSSETSPAAAFRDPIRNLVVYNLVHLHLDTSQFSAQGLSRTLAAVVSASSHLEIERFELVEGMDPATPSRVATTIWDATVPLLSQSVKIGGGKGNVQQWTGREIMVRDVARRWFDFVEVKDHAGKEGEGFLGS